jgi:uncharacterized membrane protein
VTPGALAGYFLVPVFGAMLCAAPAVTRQTLQFGIRVPPAHVGAPVIARQRHAYLWRTAAVAVCATAAVIALRGYGSWWLPRIILLAEVTADVCCFLLARTKIAAVKAAEGWFAGLRQTVVADTSWRAQPQPFPVRWLIPAIAVIAATIIIGIIRYPQLHGHLAAGVAAQGGRLPKSPGRLFVFVVGQVYATAMCSGLFVLIYRSRPDIDAAEPAASLVGYRKLLTSLTRATFVMLALINVTFLLAALQQWRIYQLSGGSVALVALPSLAGVLTLSVAAMRAGRQRVRSAVGCQSLRPPTGTDRDDDRFWKAGLAYVNRGDPAIVVPARFGVGWTFNFGNPVTWLTVTGWITFVAGLVLIDIAARL